MTVRPAVVADAAAIALVHVRSWQGAYRGLLPADFLARLDPDERRQRWERGLARSAWPGSGTLVAETEDGVVGFAHLRPSPDEDVGTVPTGQLASIYLVPAAWGRGLGRQLMDAALTALSRAGYVEATLWVLDANTRARRFYQAAGWSPDGAVQQEIWDGVPLNEVRYRRVVSQ